MLFEYLRQNGFLYLFNDSYSQISNIVLNICMHSWAKYADNEDIPIQRNGRFVHSQLEEDFPQINLQ